jgi:hypothetical protein
MVLVEGSMMLCAFLQVFFGRLFASFLFPSSNQWLLQNKSLILFYTMCVGSIFKCLFRICVGLRAVWSGQEGD